MQGKEKMMFRLQVFVFAIATVLEIATAQDFKISGRVVNSFQNPLSGCVVVLKSNGMVDTTNQNGEFELTNVTSNITQPKNQRAEFRSGRATFLLKKQGLVNIRIYSLAGKVLHSWQSNDLKAGLHSINPSTIISDALPAGIYVVQLITPEDALSFKISTFNLRNSLNGTEASTHEGKAIEALAKTSAAGIDTLEITLENYEIKKIPLDTLFISLGNIRLDAIQENVPPSQPQAVYPTNGQQNIANSILLRWECTDQDGDTLAYNVLFDTVSPPSRVITERANSDSLVLGDLSSEMTYYWRIRAFDGEDSTSSQIFSFSTAAVEWDEIIPNLRRQCYIIGVEYENKIMGMGSGFAISPTKIMTNAHVVNGLIEIAELYGMDDKKFVAVRDGGTIDIDYSYELDKFAIHPNYDSTTNYTYDFAIVTIKSGTLSDTSVYETEYNLHSLSVGSEIATIGFPGETNDLNTVNPIATYKSGTISALRPFNPDNTPSNGETNVVIQHNFNTTGGTSGSPVFNKKGLVIAIHNSGEYDFIKNEDGTWTRVPVGSLGYSIRIDQRAAVESEPLTAFSTIEPKIVNYYFINGTLTDLQFYYRGTLMDTIEWLDTLSYWDYKGEPVDDVIELYSIVATDNYLYWQDTMQTGLDFSREYIVTDDYFLYGLTNNTNKTVKSCVVSNPLQYDSTYLYLSIGSYRDVGYYKASSMTDFRLYFYSATQLIYWDDIDTRSSTNEAKYVPLEATLTLSKRLATAADTKTKEDRKRTTYYRGDLLRKLGE
ncbi:MAG: trypsin-like serine protease [Candidatus Lokiarchaeota archaeon]|nr:trypsin-like serine protease [Candidatus Lokiarchaeota archaeon]